MLCFSRIYCIFLAVLSWCACLHIPHENILVNTDAKDELLPKNVAADGLPLNGELFEGDIYMDNRLRRAVRGVEDTKRSASLKSYKWPGGIIYYIYDETFTAPHQKLLNEAIREYEMRTCIRFIKQTNQKDYVIFTAKKKGCASYVGRIGGPQYTNLEINCGIVGTYEHEIMHVLGFIHEHTRPDRDDYIKIDFKNVDSRAVGNFQKYKFANNLKEKFNYASIMLYRNNAFTTNGKLTISAVGDSDLWFGQRRRFSIGDVKQINRLYNCQHYLRHPFYAGLFGEYHGNKEREKIVRDGKKENAMATSLLEVLNFDQNRGK